MLSPAIASSVPDIAGGVLPFVLSSALASLVPNVDVVAIPFVFHKR